MRLRTAASLVALLAITACSSEEPGNAAIVGGPTVDAGRDSTADSPARETGAPDATADGASDASDAGSDFPPDATLDAPPDVILDAMKPPGCGSVAHIGDSLSAYSEPSLTSAYASVGLSVQIDAYGGRGIIQKLPADPKSGKTAATDIAATGFTGCWVVALGTNDTANISAGAWYTRAEAIDDMMTAIDPTATARVMWVNAYTTRTTGHWRNENMVLWNQALVAAKARWANLNIYDWASVSATGVAPYSDGIHHTSAGSDVRSARIAEALVGLFPNP